MANLLALMISILAILLSATQEILAVNYAVTNNANNTAGGVRFENEIGKKYALRTMANSTSFIWNIFKQTQIGDRKDVQKVSLNIDDMDVVAYTIGGGIHFSARYIQKQGRGLKPEFNGVIFHEMTHVWQWNGNNRAPVGLIEGIADFVRLKAGLAPSHWVERGKGDRWDQGYDVTAYFLEYCDDLRKPKGTFVAQLNKKMRTGYNNSYFVDLLGKKVDELWAGYKAKYK